MDEQSRKYVAKYLEDMHSLETHGLQAIDRQVAEAQMKKHPEALSAVQDFQRTLQSHIAALESRMKALGTSTSNPTTAIQDAAAGVAGVVAGIYNQVRTEAASKSIRDDYTFLSHSSIAYLMLHTTSMSLGDQETATLAERGYRDTARLIMTIDRIMPRLVVEEIQQNGMPGKDVSEQCRTLIHDAWNRQAATAGMSAS